MIENTSFSDDLRRYIGMLIQWWWIIVLATVVAALGSFLVSIQMTPVYRASATMLINEAPSSRSNEYTAILTSERLTQTYSQMVTMQPVLEGVIERLGLGSAGIEPAKLASDISVSPVRDTQLIEVSVEDTDPNRAALIANTLIMVFSDQNRAMQVDRYTVSKTSLEQQLRDLEARIEQINTDIQNTPKTVENQSEISRLETTATQYRQTYANLLLSLEQVRLSEAQSVSSVVLAEPARTPQSPIRPRTVQNTLLAAVVGAMLAFGVIFLIEALDDTVKTPEDITHAFGVPVLGIIATHDDQPGSPITVSHPRSPVSEAFRTLRTNMQFASVDHPLRTLLITSPSPADGKSTVAVNLGVVFAQSARNVILLDADLRRPTIHKRMNLVNRQGLSALFVQPNIRIDGMLQKTPTSNLDILTSGDLPPNPAELLGSEKMHAILEHLKEQATMVIIDSPPIMAVTDAAVLSSRVDGVIVVIKPGSTKTAALRHTLEQLQRVNARILGVVVNNVEMSRTRYAYYYSRYYAYYDYYGRGKAEKTSRRAKTFKPTPTNDTN
ncbi:MAG: hypothetical protein OHK0052_13400 [Anaerolineales bacterium]